MEDEWISVEDRLPEDGVEVLACVGSLVSLDDGFASRYVAWLDYDGQSPEWVTSGEQLKGVTHWQPLPVPPLTEEVPMTEATAKKKLSRAMAYLFLNRVYRSQYEWVDAAAHDAYMILFKAHCSIR